MSGEPSNKFAQHAIRHRLALDQHGYRDVTQFGLSGSIARNQQWKTYWRATTSGSTRCVIKVNYGYEDPDINLIAGQKEAQLPIWFARHFEQESMIMFPDVIDYWEQDGHSYVVFADQTFTHQSLFSIATRPELATVVRRFLDVWSQIPMPPWWQPAMEIHDFACQAGVVLDPNDAQAFGFDLGDNIGLDSLGRLFFFDFEFIQWASPQLQRAYWCCKLAVHRRHLIGLIAGKGFAASLLNGSDLSDTSLPCRQAGEAFLTSIRHKRKPSILEATGVRVAQSVMRTRSG